MEILSFNTNTGIKKTVCYTEEFTNSTLIIEQLSQGMKVVVKNMNKSKEKKQTNKQTPIRYHKETGLQQCHQSGASCLPRTRCSKDT